MFLDATWLLTIFIGLLTWLLVRHYMKIRELPSGPFPLPLIGNLRSFKSEPAGDVLRRFRKKYGDIFTIWLGVKPFVMVCGLHQIKEALLERRNDFAGRADSRFTELYLDGNCSIIDTDYGRPWETLRKMGLAAIRKYAVSEQLPPLVDDLTEEFVWKMLQENGPFDPKDHLHLTIYNIIASSILGQRFQNDDPDFLTFRDSTANLEKEFAIGSNAEFIPILRPFYKRNEKRVKKACKAVIDLMSDKLHQHIVTYENGLIRDMIDSLLSAREEVIAEGTDSAVYMNDKSLTYATYDLFSAAIETTHITLRWVLLYLAAYKDMQEKVIEELRDQIGDRIPVQEDRKRCPFTSAVINEVLRIRVAVPFGLPHKAMCDSQIGGHRLPKGTLVAFYLDAVHKDPNQWENPERFYPERFLKNDGRLAEARLSQFLPFSQGRRSCIGEKLAIVEMFMVVAGIFRCRISLKEPPEDMKPMDVPFFYTPKDHKIIAEKLDK